MLFLLLDLFVVGDVSWIGHPQRYTGRAAPALSNWHLAGSSPRPARGRKATWSPAAVTMRGLAAATRRIAGRFGLHLWGRPAFSPAPVLARGSGRIVIKTFRAFTDDAATDKTLERTQRSLIFRRDETDRIADGKRASRAPDAMDII